jgi:predicted nucleic acid-binding protein
VILPDVNVLINAFRADAGDHVLCRNWLQKVVDAFLVTALLRKF